MNQQSTWFGPYPSRDGSSLDSPNLGRTAQEGQAMGTQNGASRQKEGLSRQRNVIDLDGFGTGHDGS